MSKWTGDTRYRIPGDSNKPMDKRHGMPNFQATLTLRANGQATLGVRN